MVAERGMALSATRTLCAVVARAWFDVCRLGRCRPTGNDRCSGPLSQKISHGLRAILVGG